ncbi:MAG: adenylosuccinate synthetase, partial [Patescibacteria group bacterium]
SLEETYEKYVQYGRELKKYLGDAVEKLGGGPPIRGAALFEGAQGTFLDMAFGTYPYTVGCHTLAGSVFDGVGMGIRQMKVLGVVKAYTTRVGGGPFPTEQDNKIGQYLRDRGAEYGTVSKRPRRCGWLDLTMIKNAVKWNGFTELAITKLDVLTGLKTVKICVAHDKNGKPIYREFPGWTEEINSVRRLTALPLNCQKYLSFLEKQIAVPVKIISVGPEREQTINN